MKLFLRMGISLLIGSGVGCAWAEQPVTAAQTLSNGVRVVSIHFPGSTNVAIFTYLPLGLAADGPQQAQWSHLVEHLVIRTTVPANSASANAETGGDNMRFDFYGSLSDWHAGLSHHRRWLQGVPFTQTSLEAEKPKVNSECDFTAKNFATHKFAFAAWAQGFRHGQTNAMVKGDVVRASLAEIQGYRDQRLAVLSNVVVCIVGGVPPAGAQSAAADELGALISSAHLAAVKELHSGDREMTWDLNARHLLLTWPIPSAGADDFPALLAAAQWLNMQLFSDVELKTTTGMVLAGADLATPEGNFFYVSASLRPSSTFKNVRENLEQQIRRLIVPDGSLAMVPMVGHQLAQALTTVPDPKSMSGQLPPSVTPAMMEMNLGLQWGMNEFRYGSHRPEVARKLTQLKAEDVQRVAKIYLTESKRSVFTLRPGP